MAQDLNKQHLLGNVGSDATLEALPNGTPVLRFRLASNDVYKVDGETRQETHWFTCKVLGKRAEALQKHIVKGARLYVTGKTVNNTVEKEKDGVSYKTTFSEVRVDELLFQSAAPQAAGTEAEAFSDGA